MLVGGVKRASHRVLGSNPKRHPLGAKARWVWVGLAARLKSCPFKTWQRERITAQHGDVSGLPRMEKFGSPGLFQ